jgi:hypothetical protein
MQCPGLPGWQVNNLLFGIDELCAQSCVDLCDEVSTTCVSGWIQHASPQIECLTHSLTQVVLTSCSTDR